MARPFLSVIIPAHNAAARLPFTLIEFDRYLAGQDFSYEMIVVNDGSTDQTGELVERLTSFINYVKGIQSVERRGEGHAVRLGMMAARGTWRLVVRADGAIAPEALAAFLPYLTGAERFECIAGRRVWGRGSSRIARLLRVPGGAKAWLLNRCARLFFRLPIRDALSGFFCMSRECAERVLDAMQTRSRAHLVEAAALGRGVGFRCGECAVPWTPHGRDELPVLKILAELVTLRWSYPRTLGKLARAARTAPRGPDIPNPPMEGSKN